MIGRFSGQEYRINTSFETLLAYRAEKGFSYLTVCGNIKETVRLMYLGLPEPRPHYHIFETAAHNDDLLIATMTKFLNELTADPEEREINDTEIKSEICEYKILALYIKMGLPPHLLGRLPVFAVLKAINAAACLNNAEETPEMTAQERKAFYSISPKREARIKEYLKDKCESEVDNGNSQRH